MFLFLLGFQCQPSLYKIQNKKDILSTSKLSHFCTSTMIPSHNKYLIWPKSINNFEHFSVVLTKECSSCKTVKKKTSHLFNLRKKSNESLKIFHKKVQGWESYKIRISRYCCLPLEKDSLGITYCMENIPWSLRKH